MFKSDFRICLEKYKELTDFFKKNFKDDWEGKVKSFYIEDGEFFINYDGNYESVKISKSDVLKLLDEDITF